MSIETSDTEYISLGELLRQARIEQGFDLDQVSVETKITITNLTAMEEDDFETLPAEAFTRGFYTLYARMLTLDPEEILQIYSREKNAHSGKQTRTTPPPNKLAQQIGNMAERPSVMPGSCVGLTILFILLSGAFICWYFSWNPATYLSEKLRAFQNQDVSTQVEEQQGINDSDSPSFTVAEIKTSPDETTIPTQKTSPKYRVEAVFTKAGSITVTIDGESPRKLSFAQGETVTWEADEKMELILNTQNLPELTLNGIPISYPETDEEQIVIQIPEYLLNQ